MGKARFILFLSAFIFGTLVVSAPAHASWCDFGLIKNLRNWIEGRVHNRAVSQLQADDPEEDALRTRMLQIIPEAERDAFAINLYRDSGGTLFHHFRNNKPRPKDLDTAIDLMRAREDLMFFDHYLKQRLASLQAQPSSPEIETTIHLIQGALEDYGSFVGKKI